MTSQQTSKDIEASKASQDVGSNATTAPKPPTFISSAVHIILALVDFASSFSAQVTIVLSCIQAWRYYEQGHGDLAFVSTGILIFFGLWSVMILGLVSLSVQSTVVGERKAPQPCDANSTETTSGGVPFNRMNGLDLTIPTSPLMARLSPPVAAVVIFFQLPLVVLSWEALRDALKEGAKYKALTEPDSDRNEGCFGGLTQFEAQLVRNPVALDELDLPYSEQGHDADAAEQVALKFTTFLCAGQTKNATVQSLLFLKLFLATFLTFPQLILQSYVMFARGEFNAMAIFSIGNMVFGYSMAATSALQKRVDVGGGFLMWLGGMLVSAGQICNRAFSMSFLGVAFGGPGAIYLLVWMVSDTFWCVVLQVYRETSWDPITYGLFDFTVAPGGIVMLAWRSKSDTVLNMKQLWIIFVRFAFGWGAFLIALYKPTKVCEDGADFDCNGPSCCNRPLVQREVLILAGAFTAGAILGLVIMRLAMIVKPFVEEPAATCSDRNASGKQSQVHPWNGES